MENKRELSSVVPIKKICRYSCITNFNCGVAFVYDSLDKTWKIIDQNGKESQIKDYKIRDSYFSEGLARVKNDENLWGFINQKGEEIIPCKYINVEYFQEGMALVESVSTGLYGFVNLNGEEVVPCKYQYASSFQNGLAVVRNSEGLYGFVDKQGREIIKCKYQTASSFKGGLASVQTVDNLWTLININGENVVDFQKTKVLSCTEDLFCIQSKIGESYKLINARGEVISPKAYQYIENFSEGLAAVKRDLGLWGYIDASGKEVISCKYHYASPFKDGIAIVKDFSTPGVPNGKVNIIDKEGKLLSNLWFNDIEGFSDNLARVSLNGKNYIDRNGNLLSKTGYSHAENFKGGYALVKIKKSHLYGLIDTNGNRVIEPVYKKAFHFGNGKVALQALNGLWIFGDIKTGKKLEAYRDWDFVSAGDNMLFAYNNKRELIGCVDQNGAFIKDLSTKIYTTHLTLCRCRLEFIGTTVVDLKKQVLAKLKEVTKKLESEIKESTPEPVKTIGVYPGTEA